MRRRQDGDHTLPWTKVPAHVMALIPEFRARGEELFQGFLAAIEETAEQFVTSQDEVVALLTHPDGPRLLWHFMCRFKAGLEP